MLQYLQLVVRSTALVADEDAVNLGRDSPIADLEAHENSRPCHLQEAEGSITLSGSPLLVRYLRELGCRP